MFRNRLLSAFPREDLAVIAPHMREVSLGKHETLIEAGDRVSTLYFPSSAVISECVVLEDGRMVETDTVGFEGVVGLLASLTDTSQSIRSFVQIGGSAIAVEAQAVRNQALVSAGLFSLLMRGVVLVQAQSHQSAACLAYHTLSRRLARWLLVTADRTGAPAFPLTQEYMAIMLGTQRTTVNAAAAQLKHRGVLRYTRGNVTILDRPALEAQACECYRTVHEIEKEIKGAQIRAFANARSQPAVAEPD